MCILLCRRAGQSRVFACPGACRERDVEDAVPYGGNQDLRAIPDISRGSPFFGRGKPLPYEDLRAVYWSTIFEDDGDSLLYLR